MLHTFSSAQAKLIVRLLPIVAQDHLARLKEDHAFLASALQQARELKHAASSAAAEALTMAQARTAAHKVRWHCLLLIRGACMFCRHGLLTEAHALTDFGAGVMSDS